MSKKVFVNSLVERVIQHEYILQSKAINNLASVNAV